VDALKTTELPFAWHLNIAGSGVLEKQLRKQLAGDRKFTLHGKLSPEALEDVWQQTDLTIVPSLCLENAPMVIVESFARGIPVLASRVGGIPEMVREAENGWLFAAGDCNDLVNKFIVAVQSIKQGFQIRALHFLSAHDYVNSVIEQINTTRAS
jgi:glycosyltransferase involved in cell wall biosynthesis